LQKLTPFGYVPQLPIDEINYLTMGVLIVIGAVLTAAGFFFYRRRDINAIKAHTRLPGPVTYAVKTC
jgi:ABC-2 type transport system permease protein